MVAWCHLKSPKVWLSNKVNVREASVLEVGLLIANGNQRCFCLLREEPFVIKEPCCCLLKHQCCRLLLTSKKTFFGAWFHIISEEHMHPIARFLFICNHVSIIYSSCICSCWPCPTVWSTLFGMQQAIRFICMFCGKMWAQREKDCCRHRQM